MNKEEIEIKKKRIENFSKVCNDETEFLESLRIEGDRIEFDKNNIFLIADKTKFKIRKKDYVVKNVIFYNENLQKLEELKF